jgi:hypothetical protein
MAATTTNSDGAHLAGSESQGGAGQHRAASQSLMELNQRSSQLIQCDVGVYRPIIETWKYQAKATKQDKEGAAFRCILVSMADPKQYITGHVNMKGNSKEPLDKAKEKFKADLQFRISKIALDTTSKQEYIHTPHKSKIDLSKTKADPLLKSKEGDVVRPMPSMTLSECKAFSQNQRFDVTALVDSLDKPRKVSDTRQVVNVILVDGSAEEGKTQEATISFFMNTPVTQADAATMDILQQASGGREAVSLFGLQGKKQGEGYSFETSKDFFADKASGERASALALVSETLHATPKNMRDIIAVNTARRDYEAEEGSEIFCRLLSDLKTDTASDKPALWQVNWAEAAWPTGDSLLTKDGSRLYFQTSIRDISGSTDTVWMNEKSALALSQLESKDDFVAAHNEGKQLFPVLAAVKIARTVQDASDDAHLAGTKFTNLVVVHASDQPLSEAPSQATANLMPLLRDLKDDTSAILPAALHMAKTSPQYAFIVTAGNSGKQVAMPCQKIIALVRSSKNSQSSQLGSGWKLITPKVVDLLADQAGQDTQATHTLSAICTMENLPAYRLDPPRGGSQHALVTITAKIDDTFVVETVQLLSSAEAEQAKESLLKLLNLAILMHSRDRKRSIDWADSSQVIRKCTRLGRSPTDAPLP